MAQNDSSVNSVDVIKSINVNHKNGQLLFKSNKDSNSLSGNNNDLNAIRIDEDVNKSSPDDAPIGESIDKSSNKKTESNEQRAKQQNDSINAGRTVLAADGDDNAAVLLLETKELNNLINTIKRADAGNDGNKHYYKNIINSMSSPKSSTKSSPKSSPKLSPSRGANGNRSRGEHSKTDATETDLLLNGKVIDAERRRVENEEDGEKPVLRVQFNSERDVLTNSATTIDKEPYSNRSSSVGSTSSSSSSSSSDDEDEDSLDEARPPDGGWGWVVVAASFVVNLIADGITFSFGVIFVEFLNYFGQNRGKTAWIGSLFMAMPLLSGPIASFLTDRYGCRKVTIVGSVLACLGFVASSMTDSMEVLFVTFGVLAGFGLSLCYVASVVIVAYYFDKRRSFATGLSVCGSGIGTFIFAPLTQILLDEYGWRGTTLILAGLFLNLAVCGALMRDLPWTAYKRNKSERKRARDAKRKRGSSAETFSVSNNSTNTASALQPIQETDEEETPDANRLCSSLVNIPTYVHNGEKVPLEVIELLSSRRNFYNVLLHNYPSLLTVSRSFSDSGRLNNEANAKAPSNDEQNREQSQRHLRQQQQRRSLLERDPVAKLKQKDKENNNGGGGSSTDATYLWWLKRNEITPPRINRRLPTAYLKDLRVHRLSLTYRGAMLNIKRYRLRASSCPDIYRNSMTTIAKEKIVWYSGLWDFWDLLIDMFDFSHFSDMKYLLFAISNFLLYTWYDVPYVYLADNAREIGYSDTDSSMLIAIIGIVNMFGEIILGWAGDRSWINAGIVYAACMALCGAVTVLVPLVTNYWGLCTLSGLFGLFIAANYSLTSIILVELITLERFTNAYGLLLLVQGIANLIGPPLGGWLCDITGTYDLSFYLAGFFIALSGFLLVILPATKRYKRFQMLQRQVSCDCSIRDGDATQESNDKDASTVKEPKFHNILASCITGKVANSESRSNATNERV